jgi:Fe-S-cluster containining protein
MTEPENLPESPETPDPERVAALEALYAELPSLDCKGLCWHSCGPIDMSVTERARITELGVTIPGYTVEAAERYQATGKVALCPALGPFKTCGVHPVRPLICRLWGTTETMRCPFGCEPSRELTEAEGYEFIDRSREIGGSEGSSAVRELIAELARDPAMQPVLRRYMQGDPSVEPELLAEMRRRAGTPGKRPTKGKKKRRS